MTHSELMITDRLESPPDLGGPPGTPPTPARQDRTTLSCRLIMAPAPASVSSTRRILTETLRRAGRTGQLDDFQTVVSELVTNALNAIAAAIRDATAPTARPMVITVTLGLSDPDIVRLEVRDPAPGVPRPGRPLATDEFGRGLELVDALCTRWGVRRGRGHGKCVWAELGPAPEPDLCANPVRPAWIPALGDLVTDTATGRPARVVDYWKLPRCVIGLLLSEPDGAPGEFRSQPGAQAPTWVRELDAVRPATP